MRVSGQHSQNDVSCWHGLPIKAGAGSERNVATAEMENFWEKMTKFLQFSCRTLFVKSIQNMLTPVFGLYHHPKSNLPIRKSCRQQVIVIDIWPEMQKTMCLNSDIQKQWFKTPIKELRLCNCLDNDIRLWGSGRGFQVNDPTHTSLLYSTLPSSASSESWSAFLKGDTFPQTHAQTRI